MLNSCIVLLDLGTPIAKIILAVIENLARIVGFRILSPSVARYYWCVVNEGQKTTPVLGKDNLLLSTLDRGKELGVVCFLELLSRLCSYCQRRICLMRSSELWGRDACYNA